MAAKVANATNKALDQVELEPGMGSPRLGELLGIPGLRAWRVGTFPLLWCCFERGDHLGVVRLLGERQDLAAKVLNLGELGSYTLPLASSKFNESDAVERVHDGHIIAIGGLMRQSSVNADSGIPGLEGSIFRKLLGCQTSRLTEKRELVILHKPAIVEAGRDESEGRAEALQRPLDWTERQTAKAR